MSVKITELPILDSLADNDIVAGVDVSGNVTSKIEMSTLKNYIDTNTQYTAGTNIDITNNVISAPNVPTREEFDSLSTIFNAFPTESDEDESITLDGTAEVKFKKFDLKGNTSQYTTTGKNVLNACEHLYGTSNGISKSYSDGLYTISGTASSSWAYIANNVSVSLTSGTYTLSITKTLPFRIYVTLKASDNSTFTIAINSGDTYGTFNISKDIVSYELSCATMTSGTAYNQTLGIQLEKNSSKTDYEPYTGGTASPNPDYPQDVNVVSGDNEINVVGKNLFDKTRLISGKRLDNTGLPSITDNTYCTTDYFIKVEPSTTYYSTSIINQSKAVCFYNSNQEFIERNMYLNVNTFTTGATTQFIKISILLSEIDTEQLEKGSSATTYEAYVGNTYNVDLPVENLLDKTLLPTSWNNTSVTTISLNVKPNTKYTMSCNVPFYNTLANIFFYDESGTGSTNTNGVTVDKSVTVTSSANGIVKVGYRSYSGSTLTRDDYWFMIEEGEKANAYTPYGTTPIELCKIGNYQDYIYKDSDKWYLHKEIGKVVFTGGNDETWNISETSTSGSNRFLNESIKDYVVKPSTDSDTLSMYCNYFVSKSANQTYTNQEGIDVSRAGNFHVYANSTKTYTVAQFKTWLSTHILSVYYPLATSTDTEITYQPLIEQLNAVKLAMSKKGQTNISQENNDKPFIIDAEAIKDLSSVLDRIELLES